MWFRTACAALALMGVSIGVFAFAPSVTAEAVKSDAAIRVDVSGRQRMLSQRIVKALCSADLLGDPEFDEHAKRAIQLFDASLRSLHYGGGHGIEEQEYNANVLRAIDVISEQWMWLGPTYWAISQGQTDDIAISVMIEENLLLLQSSDQLVTEIERIYGGGGARPEVLRTVNRSGLMRMLSERLTKNMCFFLQGYRPDEYQDNLAEDMELMVTYMGHLEKGDALELILPPSSEKSQEKIAEMRAKLDVLSDMVATSIEQGVISEEYYRSFHDTALDFMLSANDLTNYYAENLSVR